jgi:hypothetical protein
VFPNSLNRFKAARHAVQQQPPGNPGRKIDATKHEGLNPLRKFSCFFASAGAISILAARESSAMGKLFARRRSQPVMAQRRESIKRAGGGRLCAGPANFRAFR